MKRTKMAVRCLQCRREGPQMINPQMPRCGFCGGDLADADGRPVEPFETAAEIEGFSGPPFPCPMCARPLRPDKMKVPRCAVCGCQVLAELGAEAPLVVTEAIEMFAGRPAGSGGAPSGDRLWAATLRAAKALKHEEERATVAAALALLREWRAKWGPAQGASPLPPGDSIAVAAEFAFRGACERFRASRESAGLAVPLDGISFSIAGLQDLVSSLAAGAVMGLLSGATGADLDFGRGRHDEEPAPKQKPKLVVLAAAAPDGSALAYFARNPEGMERPITGGSLEKVRQRIEAPFDPGTRLLWFVRAVYGLWAEPTHVNVIQPPALEKKLAAIGVEPPADVVRKFVEDREAIRALAAK